MNPQRTIHVTKVAENSGFCREYFQDVASNRVYAKQLDRPGEYHWFTITPEGVPDVPLDDVNFVEVDETPELPQSPAP